MRSVQAKLLRLTVLLALSAVTSTGHATAWQPVGAALAGEATSYLASLDGSAPPPRSLGLPPVGQVELMKPRAPKLDSVLDTLARLQETSSSQIASFAGAQGLDIADGRVLVMVTIHPEEESASIAQSIRAIGGEVAAQYENWLDVRLPTDKLAAATEIAGVRFIEHPPRAHRFESVESGAYQTEGVTAAGAAAWQSAGLTGQGVTVAIFDSFKNYSAAMATGDLPPQIGAYPNAGSVDVTSSVHGTAVAEVIHDMAPGASLVFATPQTPVQRATYIMSLAQMGVKVISSSTGTVADTPGDGTGPVADAIGTAANQYGLVYVQAAGNQAQYHWDGTFADADGDGWHEFAPGIEVNILNDGNPILAGTPLNIYLRWDDWPASNQDYDLYIVAWNGAGWSTVAYSANTQSGTQPPKEAINSYVAPVSGYYGIAIDRYNATRNVILDLNAYSVPPFSVRVPQRSLIDDATAPSAVAVAAVDAGAPYPLEPYSSRGPTRGPGGAMSGGYAKPDLAAYANVSTYSYGSRTAGLSFNGTSAATPHVSGAVALLWSGFPTYSGSQIVGLLKELTVDLGAAGYDYEYGYGRLYLGGPPMPNTIRLFLPYLVRP